MKQLAILLVFAPFFAFSQQESPFRKANQIIVLSQGQVYDLTVRALQTLSREGYQITHSDKEVGIISAKTEITSYATAILNVTVMEGRMLLTGKLSGSVWGDEVTMEAELRGRSDNRTKVFEEMQRVASLLNGYQVLYAKR